MTDPSIKISDRIELRPVILPDDEEFLIDVYASSRDDLQYFPFDEAGKKAFVLMQYTAQKNHYAEYYGEAKYYVVMFDGIPAGRYWVDYGKEDIRIVDIAILPEFRGHGIGTELVKDALKHSKKLDVPCALHVVKESRALNLYERLGFRITGEIGFHHKMEWNAPETA